MYKIGVLLFEGCWATQVQLVKDLFHLANTLIQQDQAFEVSIVANQAIDILCASGSRLLADTCMSTALFDALVIPALEGKLMHTQPSEHCEITNYVKQHLQHDKTVISFSTGAYFLAKTAITHNILLTTHWAFVHTLKQIFPHQPFTGQYAYLCHEQIYSTSSLQGCVDALLKIIEARYGKNLAQLCSSYFLVQIVENRNPHLPNYRHHRNDMIHQVQDWLDHHYANNIKIAQLAQMFGYSERTLMRHFQQTTQITLTQYYQLLRLQQAKQLLQDSDLTVQQISYQVGYENVSFFIRLFNQHFSTTPAAWRDINC